MIAPEGTVAACCVITLAEAERIERLAQMAALETEQVCLPGAAQLAAELLHQHVSGDEWAQLCTHGHVECASVIWPGWHYRISRKGGMVRLYQGEELCALLCARPSEPVPLDDVVLLHLVSLRADERLYRRTANTFYIAGHTDCESIGGAGEQSH